MENESFLWLEEVITLMLSFAGGIFAASGLIKAAKEELYEMVRQRASEYMQQAGIGKERENDGENK